MTTAVAKPKKKRSPKRLTADQLKERVKEREKKSDYNGVKASNVQWDTLRFDEKTNRQYITINTVDENGKLDNNTREVATSDLHHTNIRHTKEISDAIKRQRQNAKRAEKRKNKNK